MDTGFCNGTTPSSLNCCIDLTWGYTSTAPKVSLASVVNVLSVDVNICDVICAGPSGYGPSKIYAKSNRTYFTEI